MRHFIFMIVMIGLSLFACEDGKKKGGGRGGSAATDNTNPGEVTGGATGEAQPGATDQNNGSDPTLNTQDPAETSEITTGSNTTVSGDAAGTTGTAAKKCAVLKLLAEGFTLDQISDCPTGSNDNTCKTITCGDKLIGSNTAPYIAYKGDGATHYYLKGCSDWQAQYYCHLDFNGFLGNISWTSQNGGAGSFHSYQLENNVGKLTEKDGTIEVTDMTTMSLVEAKACESVTCDGTQYEGPFQIQVMDGTELNYYYVRDCDETQAKLLCQMAAQQDTAYTGTVSYEVVSVSGSGTTTADNCSTATRTDAGSISFTSGSSGVVTYDYNSAWGLECEAGYSLQTPCIFDPAGADVEDASSKARCYTTDSVKTITVTCCQ